MKRSKIFLGIATGVLAVVAFTAAKTAKFTHRVEGYITSSLLKCTLLANAVRYYTVGAAGSTLAKTEVFGVRTIFEYNNSVAPCAHALLTLPGAD